MSEPPSDLMPVGIEREGPTTIRITWNDQTETRWTIAELRKACPCATCREKRRGDETKESRPTGCFRPHPD